MGKGGMMVEGGVMSAMIAAIMFALPPLTLLLGFGWWCIKIYIEWDVLMEKIRERRAKRRAKRVRRDHNR